MPQLRRQTNLDMYNVLHMTILTHVHTRHAMIMIVSCARAVRCYISTCARATYVHMCMSHTDTLLITK